MAEQVIDALGDFCPVPIIKVQNAIKKLQPGDRIVLLTDHSCTVGALKEEMVRKRLGFSSEEVDYGIWQITITQPGSSAEPVRR